MNFPDFNNSKTTTMESLLLHKSQLLLMGYKAKLVLPPAAVINIINLSTWAGQAQVENLVK